MFYDKLYVYELDYDNEKTEVLAYHHHLDSDTINLCTKLGELTDRSDAVYKSYPRGKGFNRKVYVKDVPKPIDPPQYNYTVSVADSSSLFSDDLIVPPKKLVESQKDYQPRIYKLYFDDSQTLELKAGMYTITGEGNLIVCAKIFDPKDGVEYEEIANFAKGSWKAIVIMEFIK